MNKLVNGEFGTETHTSKIALVPSQQNNLYKPLCHADQCGLRDFSCVTLFLNLQVKPVTYIDAKGSII